VTPESIIDIGRHATVLAKSEGLGAHALSLMLRLDRAKTSVDE
jgi:histidinol dehydrogenase